ncbi:Gfo/Idh/MocA family protein [Hyphococcus sp.]|uniref:Gfo/Idh/MocA family protein n=1 Tax=Hyphococcus sp. TaxID=2038636 RepID=UPI0035C7650C
MKAINVGLIGTGYIGKSHALAFRAVKSLFPEIPEIHLSCVCDLDPALAERMRAGFGFADATTQWRDIINDPEIDLVSIATPNAFHREMACAALEAGKHVYCEKPMGVAYGDAKTMAEAAEKAPGQTMLAYNYLRSPAFAHALKLVGGGELGRIYFLRGVCEEEYLADPNAPFSWRCLKGMAGAGALGDLGSHLLCAIIALMGPPTDLVADMSTLIPDRKESEGSSEAMKVENEDVAHALMTFAAGATASFTTSRVSWGRKNRLAFDIYGEKGSIHFDQERMNELQLFEKDASEENNGLRTILIGPSHPPYDRFIPSGGHQLGFNDLKTIEIAKFAEAIQSGKPVFPTFADGLSIERCMDAIMSSAAARAWRRVSG